MLVGDERLLLIGWSATALAIFLPNVPQVFRYREYRRKPEELSSICWRPNLVWALLSALAFVVSLFACGSASDFFISNPERSE